MREITPVAIVRMPGHGQVRPALRARDRIGRMIFPVLVPTIIAAGIMPALTGCSEPDAPLPVYWQAPDFALTDQQGGTIRTADLRGDVWVASFVFTNCTDVCPLITQQMAQLRDSLREDGMLGGAVRLLSFSVDPARDTPATLREYAARFGGSPPAEWAFLTGEPPDAVRGMIQEGFKLTAMMPPGHENPGGDYQVMHSPRIVLVDAEGQVRGVYDTTEPDVMERLRADLGKLLEQTGQA